MYIQGGPYIVANFGRPTTILTGHGTPVSGCLTVLPEKTIIYYAPKTETNYISI